MVWDINTKFLPVEDHNRRQLLTKFEGSWCAQIWISCQNILKLKWAWRAQFLSYAFQILQKCITFEDAQMILLWPLDICNSLKVSKNSKDLHVHFCSLSLVETTFMKIGDFQKLNSVFCPSIHEVLIDWGKKTGLGQK